MTLKKINELFINFLIFTVLFSFTYLESKELCIPDFELDTPTINVTPLNDTDKNSVYVLIDGSLSMQGFVNPSDQDTNLYVEVIDDLQQIAESIGNETYYLRFGRWVKSIRESEAARATDPSFYTCPHDPENCDNQETRLDEAIKTTQLDKDATYIIVTDLFIENKNLIGGKLHQLKKPLNKVLDSGKSIGIIGIMNSFNGTIYGIPISGGGVATYSRANKRPFYIMVIGDQKNIHKVKTKLEKQYFTNNADDYKFSLITSNPIIQNLSINKKVNEKNLFRTKNQPPEFKFEYIKSNLPLYQFNTNQKRILEFTIKKNEFIVLGSSGISNYEIKETLWNSIEVKCKAINSDKTWKKTNLDTISTWKEIIIPASANNEKIDAISIYLLKKLNVDPKEKESPLVNLWRGFRYFHVVNIYADKPGNISEDIFKDWSITKAQAQKFIEGDPVVFKTLNLVKLVKVLNDVANERFKPTLIASIALDFNLTK
jgi:hypothetical protein